MTNELQTCVTHGLFLFALVKAFAATVKGPSFCHIGRGVVGAVEGIAGDPGTTAAASFAAFVAFGVALDSVV